MPYCWNSQDSFSFAFFAGIGLPISAHSLIALSRCSKSPSKVLDISVLQDLRHHGNVP